MVQKRVLRKAGRPKAVAKSTVVHFYQRFRSAASFLPFKSRFGGATG